MLPGTWTVCVIIVIIIIMRVVAGASWWWSVFPAGVPVVGGGFFVPVETEQNRTEQMCSFSIESVLFLDWYWYWDWYWYPNRFVPAQFFSSFFFEWLIVPVTLFSFRFLARCVLSLSLSLSILVPFRTIRYERTGLSWRNKYNGGRIVVCRRAPVCYCYCCCYCCDCCVATLEVLMVHSKRIELYRTYRYKLNSSWMKMQLGS